MTKPTKQRGELSEAQALETLRYVAALLLMEGQNYCDVDGRGQTIETPHATGLFDASERVRAAIITFESIITAASAARKMKKA